jgi:hypothetical protein
MSTWNLTLLFYILTVTTSDIIQETRGFEFPFKNHVALLISAGTLIAVRHHESFNEAVSLWLASHTFYRNLLSYTTYPEEPG